MVTVPVFPRFSQPNLHEQQQTVRERALSGDEVERLLSACREPYRTGRYTFNPPPYLYPLVLLLLRTGCRIGELVRTVRKDPLTGEKDIRDGLQWENIDWEEGYIVVDGKTGPRETPVIAEDALEALRELQHAQGLTRGHVFRDGAGCPAVSPRSRSRPRRREQGLAGL